MRSPRLVSFITATLLAAALPGLALAGDACKNVKFKITNKHDSGNKILLKRVEYFNKANGKWQSEVVNQSWHVGVPDGPNQIVAPPLEKEPGLECAHGDTCTTGGDDLRDAEGEQITKFRFIYKYWAAGKWSGEVDGGVKETVDSTCFANKVYAGANGGFAIFGKS